tara:strand:+ start:29 stop:265 length:237 start_codon:yes stop_codon:yes gene_type:complete
LNLDPKVRQKLLKESRTPFLGFRRLIWGALLGSAVLGLIIMFTRILAGEYVPLSDLGVQFFALILFGGLIFVDRSRET